MRSFSHYPFHELNSNKTVCNPHFSISNILISGQVSSICMKLPTEKAVRRSRSKTINTVYLVMHVCTCTAYCLMLTK